MGWKGNVGAFTSSFTQSISPWIQLILNKKQQIEEEDRETKKWEARDKLAHQRQQEQEARRLPTAMAENIALGKMQPTPSTLHQKLGSTILPGYASERFKNINQVPVQKSGTYTMPQGFGVRAGEIEPTPEVKTFAERKWEATRPLQKEKTQAEIDALQALAEQRRRIKPPSADGLKIKYKMISQVDKALKATAKFKPAAKEQHLSKVYVDLLTKHPKGGDSLLADPEAREDFYEEEGIAPFMVRQIETVLGSSEFETPTTLNVEQIKEFETTAKIVKQLIRKGANLDEINQYVSDSGFTLDDFGITDYTYGE